MSATHDDFEKLKKLLDCKRYEQPPPGYFNSFSEKIVVRLEADELVEYSSWWGWLVDKFDAKPVVACVYGCLVSGLLMAGFRLSQVFENEASTNPLAEGPWLGLATTQTSNGILPSEIGQPNFLESSASSLSTAASANFRTDTSSLLFDRSPHVRPLSFNAVGY